MNYRETVKNKGLKVTWIAKKIGISQPMLSMYLNNTRPMPNHIEDSLKEILN